MQWIYFATPTDYMRPCTNQLVVCSSRIISTWITTYNTTGKLKIGSSSFFLSSSTFKVWTLVSTRFFRLLCSWARFKLHVRNIFLFEKSLSKQMPHFFIQSYRSHFSTFFHFLRAKITRSYGTKNSYFTSIKLTLKPYFTF